MNHRKCLRKTPKIKKSWAASKFCATLAAQKAEQNVMSLLQNAHPLVLHFWSRCTYSSLIVYILAFYANNWLKMRNSCRFLSASIEFWAREKKAASVFVSRSASMVKKE